MCLLETGKFTNTKKSFYPPKFAIILLHKKSVIVIAWEAEVEMNHPDFLLKPELGKNLCNLRNLKNGMIYHQNLDLITYDQK